VFTILFLKKIWKSFEGLRLNTQQALSDQQLDYMMVSSMYAAQQSAFLNSYHTGLYHKDLQKLLTESWSISHRQDAIQTLGHLLQKNRDVYIPLLYEAYEKKDKDFLKENLPTHQDLRHYYLKMYQRLENVISELLLKGVFTSYSDIKRVKDSGWNTARGSFVARCCFDVGLISKQELQKYLEKFYLLLKTDCITWQEYVSSYIFGRALWVDSQNMEVISIGKDLLHKPKSPLYHKKYL
jgi:Protein of unknown function (DUF1266)